LKCDICDEEFDTENQLMQHKAKMHAGESVEPKVEERMPETEADENLEEPDYKRAVNE